MYTQYMSREVGKRTVRRTQSDQTFWTGKDAASMRRAKTGQAVQADLSIRWPHISGGMFSHMARKILWRTKKQIKPTNTVFTLGTRTGKPANTSPRRETPLVKQFYYIHQQELSDLFRF